MPTPPRRDTIHTHLLVPLLCGVLGAVGFDALAKQEGPVAAAVKGGGKLVGQAGQALWASVQAGQQVPAANAGSEAVLSSVALVFAPLALIAPLGGLSVIFNSLLLRAGLVCGIKEKLSLREWLCTVVVLIGVTAVAVSGPGSQESAPWQIDALPDAVAAQPAFVVCANTEAAARARRTPRGTRAPPALREFRILAWSPPRSRLLQHRRPPRTGHPRAPSRTTARRRAGWRPGETRSRRRAPRRATPRRPRRRGAEATPGHPAFATPRFCPSRWS